jgi:hypothetical protein
MRFAIAVLLISVLVPSFLVSTGADGGRSPPVIAFTYPPAGYLNYTSVEFRGTTSDNVTVTLVELSRDNGAHWTTATDTGGASPWSAWSCSLYLPDGAWTIIARANDTAGFENHTAMVVITDTVAPTIGLLSPSPGCVTNAPSIAIAGWTDPESTLTIDRSPVALSGGSFNITVALKAGWNVWELLATDPAGNEGRESVAVLRDTTPPNLTVLSPRDDFLTNQTQMTVIGQTDPGTAVTVGGAPAAVGPDGRFNGTAALVPGNNIIEVVARDTAGNDAVISVKGFMDNVPPFLNAWAAVTLTNQSSALVFGETEPGSNVSVAGRTVPPGEFGNFSAMVDLATGNNRITVSSHDRAGNYNFAVVEVLQDNIPPELTVLKPSDGEVLNAPSLEVCGTSSDANGIAGIEVGVDDQNYTFAAGNVSWRGMVMVPEGNHTVDVLVYDRTGNSNKTSRRVSYVAPAQDRTPPVITVQYPLAAHVAAKAIDVRGMVFDQSGVSSVQISTDNRTFRSCTLSASRDEWSVAVTLLPGANTFYVRAWDTQGNNATRTLKVDYLPTPSSSPPPNWGLPVLVGVIILAAVVSIYMMVNVLWRWTDNIEPGLGEDEALIEFPGKGLK